jgi:hypothetical protein
MNKQSGKPQFRFQPLHLLFLGLGAMLLPMILMPAPPDAISHSSHLYMQGRGGTYDVFNYSNYITWLNSQPGGPFIVILSWFAMAGSLLWAGFLWLTKEKDPKSY